MSERWEELESTVRRLEDRYERSRRNMYYSERAQMEQDIKMLKDEAARQRDRYVNWLWGHG